MLVNFQESGGSLDDLIERVRTAWRQLQGESPEVWSYVCDVFPDHAYVKYGDYANPKYWRVPYSSDDSGVTFAPREQWESYTLDYVPVAAEDGTVEESFRGFIEATRGKPTEAVIIVEGKSTNGRHYTSAALQSGIAVFSGRPIFADHPTAVEETQRPERSVRDVVGRLGQAYVGKDKNGNPALRAPVVMSEAETGLRTKIKEGIIGDLSIHATGSGKRNADGEFVVESFIPHPHTSVDLVTVGAAGGYVDLQESVREVPAEDEPETPVEESAAATEIIALRESNQRLLEQNTTLFRQARTYEGVAKLQTVLRDSPLPAASQKRVRENAKPLLEAYGTHGSQQTIEQLTAELTKLAEAEKTYLAQVAPNGAVTGLQLPIEESKTAETILTEAFKGLVPDDQLKIAVRGRYLD
ncbi:MAG: hypothetical protein BroJett018_16540 [Chloroflexota bacterium]|nr:hypothetical protein [Chloroflexota bacterium]NOG65661.1 hypothetical protein [Chloroflexota bacterium]GIK63860.1 MAG: hypothetical protein BroJett018_16540 [Chloroflexota bacterium]